MTQEMNDRLGRIDKEQGMKDEDDCRERLTEIAEEDKALADQVEGDEDEYMAFTAWAEETAAMEATIDEEIAQISSALIRALKGNQTLKPEDS